MRYPFFRYIPFHFVFAIVYLTKGYLRNKGIKGADWTTDDCKSFRPAPACLTDKLQKRYPKAEICFILNSELKEPVNESMREVCKHYNIKLIELHDIEKQNGHPLIKGVKSICEQLPESGL